MPALENPRYERFAQLRANGKTGSDAYRGVVGPDAKNPDATADQWMKKPGVRERIEELKAETASHCSISREELVNDLVAMFRSKPEDASLSNPLCETLVTRGQRIPVFPQKM